MKITEALKILNLSDKEARPFDVLLVCGFTPLHLQTLLAAHLQLRQPDRSVRLATGQFGNLAQTLEGAEDSGPTNIAVVLEWSDIDSRLGYRAAATWDSTTLDDIQSAARDAFDRVQHAIERIRQKATVVVCPPTLPLPPVVTGAGWETGPAELALARVLADFNAAIAEMGVSVVNPSRLAEESPVGQRRDLKSDLYAGFPYSLSHADAMASALSSLLFPPAFKKGLITDLDDTLWSGLAGEVGPDGVHWDLERRSHVHALYQMLLASLADSGALLAVASKNDPRVVDAVFEREDLLVQKEQMFPIEVHWQPKSASVGRILRTWNVSADAVVFVDDSALELAEVAEAHPGVQCLQFSAKDHGSVYSTLRRIRDLFGRPHSSAEDVLRLESIRQGARFQEEALLSHSETFLRDLKAVVQIEYETEPMDRRALELVNKTNQFNMNGVRYTESDWIAELSDPRAFLMTVTYEDRFGKLGKIATMLGRQEDDVLRLNVWVMSCRAFGRRIEYYCLQKCFERIVGPISFHFEPTPRNQPFREFLSSLLGGIAGGPLLLTPEQFDKVCPPLYQTSKEARSAAIHG